jgi:flagellar assembly protein FliH
MGTTQHPTDSEEMVTVARYRPPQYIQAEWPVVRNEPQITHFTPAEFEQVGEAVYEVDAMFADFGMMTKGAIELSKDAGDFELHPVAEPSLEVQADLVAGSTPENSEERLVVDSITAIPEQQEVVEGLAEGSRSIRGAEAQNLAHSEQAVEESTPSVGDEGDTESHEHQGAQQEVEELQDEPNEQESSHVQLDESALHAALQESYEQGRLSAREEVTQAQLQLEERYRLLWEDMQTQLDEVLRLNETKAVELAMQVAKRMVGNVVENQRDYIHQVIQEAIKLTAGAEISAIRVSPQDYEYLQLNQYGDKKKVVAGEHISFISDESIRAGCVLVTTAGEVDFDLDKAWERIRSKALQEPEQ